MNPKEKRRLTPRLRFPEFRDAGEWGKKKLGEIGDVLMCKRIFAEETNGIEGVPFFKIGTLGSKPDAFISRKLFDEYKSKYNFPRKGEILITCSGTVGKCLPYDGNDAYYQDSNIVWIDNPTLEVSNEFLYDILLNVDWGRLNSTTITRIYGSDLRNLSITFPTNQNEQQKIADCLTSLDALIAAHTQKLAVLRTYKQGLLQQLFPAEGETLPRLRFPEFRDAPEWEENPLELICNMQAGQFVAASDISEQYVDGLYPCYGGNGLRGYTRTFTHSGTYPLIGRQGALCGNIKLGTGQFHATEHAVVVIPKDKIDVKWLFYDLVNLNLNQYATGQAQPGLSVAVLEKVCTVIPANIQEQRKIADCLTALDALIAAQTQKLAALAAHKKGLLQQLFPAPDAG